MKIQEAIMALSQSEKIKSGLIWASQAVEMLHGVPGQHKPSGEKIIEALVGMVLQEVRLAKNIAADPLWDEIEEKMDRALVMIHSGVASESVFFLTDALSRVTNMGQRAMLILKDNRLIA